MTMRIDTPTTPTAAPARRVDNTTAPLQLPETGHAHVAGPKSAPGDTAKLAHGTGDIEAARPLDLEGVVLHAGHQLGEVISGQAEPKPTLEPVEKKEKEFEPGQVVGKYGAATDNSALKKTAKVTNAAQIVVHTVQAAVELGHDPHKAIVRAKKALEADPLGTVKDAVGGVKDAKEHVKTVKEAGEVVVEHGKKLAAHVGEHGLAGGLREAGKGIGQDLKHVQAELKGNLSHSTGSGLSHVTKSITKEVSLAVEKKGTATALRELEALHPELAPKGLGKVGRAIENAGKPVTNAVEKGYKLADRVAERVARTGPVKAVLESKVVKAFHPHGNIPVGELKAAAHDGLVAGRKGATEAVMKTFAKKTGKELTGAGLHVAEEAIGRTVAEEGGRVGLKIAGKGLARFAPGANIAIAGMDIYHAGKVLRDPHSTRWQKGMASATAVFSTAAATNIPIVSQVGAGLSIASSVLENVKPATLVHAAKATGNAIAGAGRRALAWFN